MLAKGTENTQVWQIYQSFVGDPYGWQWPKSCIASYNPPSQMKQNVQCKFQDPMLSGTMAVQYQQQLNKSESYMLQLLGNIAESPKI